MTPPQTTSSPKAMAGALTSGRTAGRDRLYRDLAWTWPIISPHEDYVEEAETALRLMRAHARIPVRTLLHLGCGGGHLDWTLKRELEIVGVDRSEDMLALARSLNPEVRYEIGDMRAADLGKTFDAVAVFDSITYMRTLEDLRATFRTARRHLNEGGVFVTYAEETPNRFRQHRTRVTTSARGDVTITFVEHAFDPDPKDTVFETDFVFLIRRRGGLEVETDHHEGGLFPRETWLRALEEAKFDARVVEPDSPEGDGIPWFVAVKSA